MQVSQPRLANAKKNDPNECLELIAEIEVISHPLISLASGIGTLTVCVALALWLQKKSDREIGVITREEAEECRKKMKEINERLGLDEDDSKRQVKYREEPGTPTIIGCLGYGLVFYFLVVVIYILLEM